MPSTPMRPPSAVTTTTTTKRMKLRYAGVCRECGAGVPAGEVAIYQRASKQVACLSCTDGSANEAATRALSALLDAPGPLAPARTASPDPASITLPTSPGSTPPSFTTEGPEVNVGVGGASARREYERRKDKRAGRIRAKHPLIGGLILAVTDEPESTQAWAIGAKGEEVLAKRLDKLTSKGLCLLHDRRIPGSKANIDHLAVGPAGVFVIDAKLYQGHPQLRVEGGLFRSRVETLMVGRRDCTKLVIGVHKQVALVRAALTHGPTVPVRGMLCFVNGDWPLIGGSFTIEDLDVLWPRQAQEIITQPGPFTDDEVRGLHQRLAATFPPT